MLTTMYLSESETRSYRGATRADIRWRAAEFAYSRGSRFAQVVGSNGRILDILEVELSLDTAAE